MLQQALKHRLILKKVHRAIKFKQSTWLKPYISLNTKYRVKAKYDFQKYQYKCLNNSVIFKKNQNNRKERHIHPVTNENIRKRLVSSVNFKESKHISDFLRMKKWNEKQNKVKMNSPIFAGGSILYLIKSLIVTFITIIW